MITGGGGGSVDTFMAPLNSDGRMAWASGERGRGRGAIKPWPRRVGVSLGRTKWLSTRGGFSLNLLSLMPHFRITSRFAGRQVEVM